MISLNTVYNKLIYLIVKPGVSEGKAIGIDFQVTVNIVWDKIELFLNWV